MREGKNLPVGFGALLDRTLIVAGDLGGGAAMALPLLLGDVKGHP